ncbi:SCAN domain-containing protein 3 [Trichonephila clavipes]|uniref:SCAN domain-containing protein 3 n=1 Tax=Trichonephila clavipes TaxID=2585209 RepID=A0A8X6VCR6_TRICX|nr:SCAN domain-containing protein 3 [Trichonephila clavipes]
MKPGRLEFHLKSKDSAYVNSDLNYFKSLKEKFAKRSTIKSVLNTQTVSVIRTFEASYEISLLIGKCGKNHAIGEDFIQPLISVFLKTVLEKNDIAVNVMLLSNNTVSRIDEMSDDIEIHLLEKLKS